LADFLLGICATLCALLIIAMLCFGPRILEWIEDMPRETV
jgi:hypothetical protein